MGSQPGIFLYLLVMIAVVVVVDWRFLRHYALRRLAVNIGIVLAFGAFYLAFLHQR